MPFRFPLNTVLKYRAELEKREERALEQCRELLTLAETKLAEIKAQRSQALAECQRLLEVGILGDDLHYAREQQQHLQELEAQAEKRVAEAKINYDAEMKVFLVARQKREILDELKQSQKDAYTAQQDRRDQHTVDEIFGARPKRDT